MNKDSIIGMLLIGVLFISTKVFLSQHGKYVKDPNEDFKSILGGFTMQKGNIHVDIGKPINELILEVNEKQTNNEIIQDVAAIIDREVHKNYKLWPTNYLAHDLLENSKRFEEHYNSKTEEVMEERCQMAFDLVNESKEELRKLFDTRDSLNNLRKGDYCSSTEQGYEDAYHIHFRRHPRIEFYYNKTAKDYYIRCIRKF